VPLHKINDMLLRNSLFAGLAAPELDALTKLLRQSDIKTRAVVCHQGDPGNSLYVVLSGLLKVVTSSEDGHEVVLSMLGPGMTFGEIALLDGRPRSASVIACQASTIATIDRHGFNQFLANYPETRDKLIVALCGRIRTLTDRVEDLSALEVPARLARTLIALSETLGSELQGKRYVHARISQGEIGSMVGAARESINKIMRQWEDKGVISIVDGRVQILRPETLAIISQQGESTSLAK